MAIIDDRELYIPPTSRVCDFCRHRRIRPYRTCTAFPDGIPLPIWRAEHDHRTAYAGDRGIRWAPLRPEDLEVLKSAGRGERPVPGMSVAEAADQMLVGAGATPDDTAAPPHR